MTPAPSPTAAMTVDAIRSERNPERCLLRAATAMQVACYESLACDVRDIDGQKRELAALKAIHAEMAAQIKTLTKEIRESAQ